MSTYTELAQPRQRVRILRGGYRGDYATVTGCGLAGGVTVTTDSGVPLAFAWRDLEVVSSLRAFAAAVQPVTEGSK